MAEGLMMKIDADLDSSAFLKQIEQLGKQASVTLNSQMSSPKPVGAPSDPKPVGAPSDGSSDGSSGGGMSGIKNIFKTLKSGMGMVSKIAIGVGLVMAVMKILGPALKVGQVIITLISEMLRPIGDVVMIMLMPILALMKPILIVFRGLMAPFKQAAMMGMAASQRLIGEGMRMKLDDDASNDAAGGEMVAAGMAGTLQSASLMMSGFVGSIAKMLGFENAFAKWEATATEGVVKVITLSDTYSSFNTILDNSANAWRDAQNVIGYQMDLIESSIGEFSMDTFDDALTNSGLVVDLAIGVVSGSLTDLQAAIDAFNAVAIIPVTVPQVIGGMEAESGGDPNSLVTQGAADIASSFNVEDQINRIKVMGDTLAKNVDDAPNFWQQFGNAAKETFKMIGTDQTWKETIQNQSDFYNRNTVQQLEATKTMLDGVTAIYQSAPEDQKAAILRGLEEQLVSMDEYWGNSLIPDSMNMGLLHMLNITNLAMGSEGIIPAAYNSGLDTMTSSTKTFGEVMESIAKIVAKSAKDASKAAKAAVRSAEKAAKAARSAGRRRSS